MPIRASFNPVIRFHWLHLLTLIAIVSSTRAAKVLPVLNDPIDSLTLPANRADYQIDLDSVFGTEEIDDLAVRFTSQFSSLGGDPFVMDFALFSNRTPATRANFLNYVNDGDYDNQIIHRTVPGFITQGGGFDLSGSPIPADDPVVNEFGISNTRWTVAMAKLGSSPNSATNQWFINLGENSANLDNQNGGFTAFARVLQSTQDDVGTLTSIANFPIVNLNPSFLNIPLFNTYTSGTPSVSQLNRFTTATLVAVDPTDAGESTSLTYSISANSNSGLVAASIVNGNELNLALTPGTLGSATITVTATDSVGNAVDTRFTLNVLESYDNWRNTNFSGDDINDDSISGPSTDLNKDGVTNLELFAHNLSVTGLQLSPLNIDFVESSGVTVPQFTFPFRNDIAGLSFDIEFSEDLGIADPWASVPFLEIDRESNGTIDTVTLQIDAASFTPTSPAFYRWTLQEDAQ